MSLRMGFKRLSKLIKTYCSEGVQNRELKYYSGYKIAIDASMCIYQFLVAVRAEGQSLSWGDSTTSHISGIFYRSIRWIENGIIPVFVFDGIPPEEKIHEFEKRTKRRQDINAKLQDAIERQDQVLVSKYDRMNVKMEKSHIEECQKTLRLLNIPYVIAPSEAEAYCAWLCKSKFVDAVATEDMDSLCFGSPLLLRNFNTALSQKLLVEEYNLHKILEGLQFTMEQFVDLCILLGCDYSATIRGVGMKRAFEYIKKYKSIDNLIGIVDFPDDFKYKEARTIFFTLGTDTSNNFTNENPINTNIATWDLIAVDSASINIEAVIDFLCNEKGFDKGRIETGIKKLQKQKKVNKQTRIDSFFKKKL